MNYNRKEFLKLGGSLAGLVYFGHSRNIFSADETAGKKRTFGLQLYTVRDEFEKRPAETLKRIAAMGYKQVESYERARGIYWGMTNIEFKKYMDDLGMALISSHCEIEKDFEKKAEEAAAIGMKYLIYNWPFSHQPVDEYKRKAALFNACGEICRKAGLGFAYHNYSSSFQLVDGIYPQDLLMKETDPSLVHHQMDIYWVVLAGQDPEYWLKKYPGRFPLCHIKDRIKGAVEDNASCILGEGSIDIPGILKTARKNGMQYYIVEQERYDNSTPMQSAAAGAEYMRRLRI